MDHNQIVRQVIDLYFPNQQRIQEISADNEKIKQHLKVWAGKNQENVTAAEIQEFLK